MFAANTIAREEEQGTREQPFMSPDRPAELIVGEIVPSMTLSVAGVPPPIALQMRATSGVPIHGSFARLLPVDRPFVLMMVGPGQMILEQGRPAQCRHDDDDWDAPAVDLPLRRRLAFGLDATSLHGDLSGFTGHPAESSTLATLSSGRGMARAPARRPGLLGIGRLRAQRVGERHGRAAFGNGRGCGAGTGFGRIGRASSPLHRP
jgi:hypothetical protein